MGEANNSTDLSTSKKKDNKNGTTTKPSFFTGVKKEFRKIIWPDKSTLIKQTTAVLIVSIVIGAIIAIIDRIVLYGVNLLMK